MPKIIVETNITPPMVIYDSKDKSEESAVAKFFQVQATVTADNGVVLYKSGEVKRNLFTSYVVPGLLLTVTLYGTYRLIKGVL